MKTLGYIFIAILILGVIAFIVFNFTNMKVFAFEDSYFKCQKSGFLGLGSVEVKTGQGTIISVNYTSGDKQVSIIQDGKEYECEAYASYDGKIDLVLKNVQIYLSDSSGNYKTNDTMVVVDAGGSVVVINQNGNVLKVEKNSVVSSGLQVDYSGGQAVISGSDPSLELYFPSKNKSVIIDESGINLHREGDNPVDVQINESGINVIRPDSTKSVDINPDGSIDIEREGDVPVQVDIDEDSIQFEHPDTGESVEINLPF